MLQPMYPTAVILLVEKQRSMADIFEISQSGAGKLVGPVVSEPCPTTLGHLSFEVGPVHSTTDDEAESQRSRTLQSQGGQEHGLEEVIPGQRV